MDTENLNEFPWATALTVILTVLVAVVGGAVVIFGDNDSLSFEKYVEVLTGFAVANGLLGIGRGIRKAGSYGAMGRRP